MPKGEEKISIGQILESLDNIIKKPIKIEIFSNDLQRFEQKIIMK